MKYAFLFLGLMALTVVKLSNQNTAFAGSRSAWDGGQVVSQTDGCGNTTSGTKYTCNQSGDQCSTGLTYIPRPTIRIE